MPIDTARAVEVLELLNKELAAVNTSLLSRISKDSYDYKNMVEVYGEQRLLEHAHAFLEAECARGPRYITDRTGEDLFNELMLYYNRLVGAPNQKSTLISRELIKFITRFLDYNLAHKIDINMIKASKVSSITNPENEEYISGRYPLWFKSVTSKAYMNRCVIPRLIPYSISMQKASSCRTKWKIPGVTSKTISKAIGRSDSDVTYLGGAHGGRRYPTKGDILGLSIITKRPVKNTLRALLRGLADDYTPDSLAPSLLHPDELEFRRLYEEMFLWSSEDTKNALIEERAIVIARLALASKRGVDTNIDGLYDDVDEPVDEPVDDATWADTWGDDEDDIWGDDDDPDNEDEDEDEDDDLDAIDDDTRLDTGIVESIVEENVRQGTQSPVSRNTRHVTQDGTHLEYLVFIQTLIGMYINKNYGELHSIYTAWQNVGLVRDTVEQMQRNLEEAQATLSALSDQY